MQGNLKGIWLLIHRRLIWNEIRIINNFEYQSSCVLSYYSSNYNSKIASNENEMSQTIKFTIKYRYPRTEMIPDITPINNAPCGPISRLHTDPTATPPANVAFWMCTMSNLWPWLTIAETANVVTVPNITKLDQFFVVGRDRQNIYE